MSFTVWWIVGGYFPNVPTNQTNRYKPTKQKSAEDGGVSTCKDIVGGSKPRQDARRIQWKLHKATNYDGEYCLYVNNLNCRIHASKEPNLLSCMYLYI